MALAQPLISAITPEVVQAFWAELHRPRMATHRRHRVVNCDTELRIAGLRLSARGSASTGAGYRLSGGCPCRDLVADAFEITCDFLTRDVRRLTNPAGAVRTNLRFRLVDLDRAVRRDRGAQVKPHTVRNNRYARMLPDDLHRDVLVMLADEAGCSAPLRGDVGLLDRLVVRCVAEFGGSVDEYRARLPRLLRRVEQVCRAGPRVNVGTVGQPELVTWWEAYIERPLGRRPNPADRADVVAGDYVGLPESATDQIFNRLLSTANDDAVLNALFAEVGSLPKTRRDGALCGMIHRLMNRGVLPLRRAQLLLADEYSRQVVLNHLAEARSAQCIH